MEATEFKPPKWSDVFEQVLLEYGFRGPKVWYDADKRYEPICEEWLKTLTDDQVIEFTAQLVKEHGEFETHYGVMMPNTSDRDFNYHALARALRQIQQRRQFLERYSSGDKRHRIFDPKELYAGLVEYHSTTIYGKKWYWELIHDIQLEHFSFASSEEEAWIACEAEYQKAMASKGSKD